jgi:hypothetical protein
MYSLLLDDLELSMEEREAVLAFLIEERVTDMVNDWLSMNDPGFSPEKTSTTDRATGLADIVGDLRAQQFLEHEEHVQDYSEVYKVSSMLEVNEAPLSDLQLDQLLKIRIDVRSQHSFEPQAERGSMEFVEQRLALIDEYERLVMELIPSILSTEQAELIFQRYQQVSYQRSSALELQQRRRSQDPDDDTPVWYPAQTN